MKGLLVRCGIDSEYGHWNAPYDPVTHEFIYMPIPEHHEFLPGLETIYDEIIPDLKRFADSKHLHIHNDLGFPKILLGYGMHLDPDFAHLTYGDNGQKLGMEVTKLERGDFLAFYTGLKPVYTVKDRLVYALIGLYIIDEILCTSKVLADRRFENAHTRKRMMSSGDIVVRAIPRSSGRLDKAIPIGEWRDNAYRVRNDLLDAWGGLSVKNGYITRSRVPPKFINPQKFLNWFEKLDVKLIDKNNLR